ncbi:MAG: hypothetical protein U9M89_00560, partial [Patescibacteria group bacterium]|nr:hypothetical protein [Patescibacteria group bacterium]
MTDFSEPYTDGKQNEQVKALLEQEKLYTEQEAMQEEISYRMPASIKILLKYEWKPLIRILACVGLAVAMYFIFGWDAVAMAIAIFIFTAFMAYLIKSKDMSRNATYIVETKLAGQKITTGDHSPYSKSFYVTESAFRIWEVPNVLIEN